jgi:hypothetical protein
MTRAGREILVEQIEANLRTFGRAIPVSFVVLTAADSRRF